MSCNHIHSPIPDLLIWKIKNQRTNVINGKYNYAMALIFFTQHHIHVWLVFAALIFHFIRSWKCSLYLEKLVSDCPTALPPKFCESLNGRSVIFLWLFISWALCFLLKAHLSWCWRHNSLPSAFRAQRLFELNGRIPAYHPLYLFSRLRTVHSVKQVNVIWLYVNPHIHIRVCFLSERFIYHPASSEITLPVTM